MKDDLFSYPPLRCLRCGRFVRNDGGDPLVWVDDTDYDWFGEPDYKAAPICPRCQWGLCNRLYRLTYPYGTTVEQHLDDEVQAIRLAAEAI